MIGLNDLTDNALAIDAFIGFNDHGEGDDLIGEFTVLYNGSMPAYRATIAKIIDGKDPNSMDLKEMHFHDWEKSEIGFDPQKSEISHHHVSFILPKGVISEQFVTDLVMLMKDSPRLGLKGESGKRKNQCHILWDHIGGKTTETAPAATAFYWRGGEFVMTAKVVWSDPRDEAQALAWTTWCKEVLTKYAIDGQAAYINYIDAQLAGWEAAYYGDNYPRLQQVKQAVDPDNFFNFPQSIRLPSKKQAASAPGDRPSKKSRS